ncbi:hypothetical protein BDR07DRAFT_1437147 [Suillus spraguei]|nr:hypothetical protein BDR07DRAFT_1437147 [Suillus spraguei]
MAGTWLLFAVLVRIPTTHRFCLEDPRGLGLLRLAFCILWAIGHEIWSDHSVKDLPRNLVMYYGGTLVRMVGFMNMMSFWMHFRWNRLTWSMVKNWSRRMSIVDQSYIHPSNSPMPQELDDPYRSDSQFEPNFKA